MLKIIIYSLQTYISTSNISSVIDLLLHMPRRISLIRAEQVGTILHQLPAESSA